MTKACTLSAPKRQRSPKIEPHVPPDQIDPRAIAIGEEMARARHFDDHVVRVVHSPTRWNRSWPNGWRLVFRVDTQRSGFNVDTNSLETRAQSYLFEACIEEAWLTDPGWKQKWLLKMLEKPGEIAWARRYTDELESLL